jgi:hypothetical protein
MTMLDCTDPDSALVTASAVLGISSEQLARACMRVDPDDHTPGYLLREHVRKSLPGHFESFYFHGSRTVDPAAFRRDGILPLDAALPRIWETLGRLAGDICDAPAWKRFRHALESGVIDGFAADDFGLKVVNSAHWGPYGFLVRDAALCPAGSPWHNYLCGPEIIEDICGAFEASHGVDLFGRFRKASRPCLVKFIGPGSEHKLEAALEYLVCVLHGRDLTLDVESSFDSEGAAVPPERIVAVQVLD